MKYQPIRAKCNRVFPLTSVTLTLAPDFNSNSATSSNSSDIDRDKGVNPAEFFTSKSTEFVPSKLMDSSKIMLTTSMFRAKMAKCRGVCLKESNQILNYCRKIIFWIIETGYFPNDIPKSRPLWFACNQDGELTGR